jgi:hypothetical protein
MATSGYGGVLAAVYGFTGKTDRYLSLFVASPKPLFFILGWSSSYPRNLFLDSLLDGTRAFYIVILVACPFGGRSSTPDIVTKSVPGNIFY